MIFQVVLTCLFFAEIAVQGALLDKPREPITGGAWVLNSIIHGLLIYGVWNWL